MRTSGRIVLNAASSWFASLINAAIGVVLVPFLLGQLGREGYGLIALVGVIVALTAIADLGLRGALGRHLAEQVATRNDRRYNELVSSAACFYLIAGLAIAVTCALLAPLLVKAFHVSASLMPQAVFLVRWYGSAAILLTFIIPIYGATITSNNRFDLFNYTTTGAGILKGAGLFAVLGLTGTGLYGWAAVMLASQLVRLFVLRHVAHRVKPGLQIHPRHVRRDAMRSLFSLGGYVFTFQLTNLLSVKSDPIVLTSFLGPSAVALYHPATALAGVVRPLVTTLSQQLHPLATGYHVTGKTEQLQEVLLRGTRYTFLMGIAACVIMGVFAEPIARVWLEKSLGSDYLITAWVIAGWAAVELTTYAAGSQWPVLLGMNRMKFHIWIQVPLAVVNVLVSIILVGYTSLGVVGVVIPTVAIGIIRRPIIIIYTARICGLSAGRYFRQSYLRPIIVLLLLVAAALALLILVAPASLLGLAGCVAIVGTLWLALCWFIGFNESDRLAFRSLRRSIWGRLSGRPSESASAAQAESIENSPMEEQ